MNELPQISILIYVLATVLGGGGLGIVSLLVILWRTGRKRENALLARIDDKDAKLEQSNTVRREGHLKADLCEHEISGTRQAFQVIQEILARQEAAEKRREDNLIAFMASEGDRIERVVEKALDAKAARDASERTLNTVASFLDGENRAEIEQAAVALAATGERLEATQERLKEIRDEGTVVINKPSAVGFSEELRPTIEQTWLPRAEATMNGRVLPVEFVARLQEACADVNSAASRTLDKMNRSHDALLGSLTRVLENFNAHNHDANKAATLAPPAQTDDVVGKAYIEQNSATHNHTLPQFKKVNTLAGITRTLKGNIAVEITGGLIIPAGVKADLKSFVYDGSRTKVPEGFEAPMIEIGVLSNGDFIGLKRMHCLEKAKIPGVSLGACDEDRRVNIAVRCYLKQDEHIRALICGIRATFNLSDPDANNRKLGSV